MYLPRKCRRWNLARLCVGGVMCMGRAVTRMVSKTTFLPHQIAGELRDRVMVSRRGFGFLDQVHMCRWLHVRFMLYPWSVREHSVLVDRSNPSKGNFFMHKVKVYVKKISRFYTFTITKLFFRTKTKVATTTHSNQNRILIVIFLDT